MIVANLVQSQITMARANNSNPGAQAPALDCSLNAPEGEAPTTNDLPTAEVLAKLNDISVFDGEGKSHSFRSVYAADDDIDHNLIIIVRHFFCGNCQDYIRHLASELPPSALPPRTRITIFSHGTPELIPGYVKATNCPYPMYTDPTQNLHELLGLARTLNLGKKPGYIKMSLPKMVFTGIYQGLSSKKNALKGGDSWQVGGEFLVERVGEDWKVTWGHRMKTTRDHAEADTLKEVLGISIPATNAKETTESITTDSTVQPTANDTAVNGTEKETSLVAAPQNGPPI
jgi:hypothetical protein